MIGFRSSEFGRVRGGDAAKIIRSRPQARVEARAATDAAPAPPGDPNGDRRVLRPGALVRGAPAMDAPKIAKLKAGTVVRALEEVALDDGTRRLLVSWGGGATGWISAKNTCAARRRRGSRRTVAATRGSNGRGAAD